MNMKNVSYDKFEWCLLGSSIGPGVESELGKG
jgi:hypothetical protein